MSKATRRIDYWQDPDAPKPTSRKTSASVFVRDDDGRLLLLERVDNGLWTIPTGGVKNGETVGQHLSARPRGRGSIAPEPAEASDVRWVAPEDLSDYPIHPALMERLRHGLNHVEPYIA